MLLAVVLGLSVAMPNVAFSVTRSEVDAACADSEEALGAYRDAQGEFEEASLAFEAAANEVAVVERRQQNVVGSIETRRIDRDEVSVRAEETAVELYKRGTSSVPGLLFGASSVSQVIASNQMLEVASADDMAALDELVALEADLGRFQSELTETEAELREVEATRLAARDSQEDAMGRAQAAYADLSENCKELNRTYEQEQAAARARAAAVARGRTGASAGASPNATSGFICPMSPGRTSFIDSWGFPRSGGRSHKGVDMFASWNEPVVAVVDGVVSVGSGGLGGLTVWLMADNGTAYYYAHLSDWAVGSGARVSRGQAIGYNGNSGNARGGSPHVHFEIHPGGRGGAAVNPHPTVASACF